MIAEKCESKILNMGEKGKLREAFLSMFRQMAVAADEAEAPASTVILRLYDDDSDLKPGDWAPELHLVIRKVDRVKTPEEVKEEEVFNQSVEAHREPAASGPDKADTEGTEEDSA